MSSKLKCNRVLLPKLMLACSAAAVLAFAQPASAQKADEKGASHEQSGAAHESGAGGHAGSAGGSGAEHRSEQGKSSSSSAGKSAGESGHQKSAEQGENKASSEKSSGGKGESTHPKNAQSQGREHGKSSSANGNAGGEAGKSANSEKGKSSEAGKSAKSEKGSEHGKNSSANGNAGGDTGKAASGQDKNNSRNASKPGDNDKSKSAEERGKTREGGSASGAAEGTNGMERTTKGSAAQDQRGARVQVSEQQRSTIHDRILKEKSVNRVSHVDFNISIGTRVPRSVHLVRVPQNVVEIVPEYRDYDYFVSDDDRICIVDPSSLEIVLVIDRSGGGSHEARVETHGLVLTSSERDFLLNEIDVRDGGARIPLPSEGQRVPDDIRVRPFPEVVLRRMPKLDHYKYFVADGSVVIVAASDDRVQLVVGSR